MFGQQNWKCSDCNNLVAEDVYPCPFCHIDSINQTSNSKSRNQCSNCTFLNPQNLQCCQMCGNRLSNKRSINHHQNYSDSKKSNVICPHCHQQNDLQNQECVYCEQPLYESKKIKCQICNNLVKKINYDQHLKNCLMTQQMLQNERQQKQKQKQSQRQKLRLQQERLLKNGMEECIHCRQKRLPQDMPQHLLQCQKKSKNNLIFDPKTRMTSLQMQAMRHMSIKSQKQHVKVRPELQKKIQKLGYTIQELNNLQFYVENYAPIIIHIHISKHMQFFVKDTHYRSQFQTNKSSGSLNRQSRIQWEDRMFDKKYSNAKDFQRVKYGVINFTNDPKGVSICSSYGASYFLLKEHVRERCTFSDMDSSDKNASMGTFKYCFKILNNMKDNQLKGAIDAAKAIQISSKCTSTYKEIQIHGPIQFSQDIQRLYINKNEIKDNKKLLEMVYQFCQKNHISYDFI